MNPEHLAELEAQIDFTLMEEEGNFEPQKPPQWAWNSILSMGESLMREQDWLDICNVAMLEIKETYLERLIKRLKYDLQNGYDFCEDEGNCGRELCGAYADVLDWLNDYEG